MLLVFLGQSAAPAPAAVTATEGPYIPHDYPRRTRLVPYVWWKPPTQVLPGQTLVPGRQRFGYWLSRIMDAPITGEPAEVFQLRMRRRTELANLALGAGASRRLQDQLALMAALAPRKAPARMERPRPPPSTEMLVVPKFTDRPAPPRELMAASAPALLVAPGTAGRMPERAGPPRPRAVASELALVRLELEAARVEVARLESMERKLNV